MVDIVRSNIVVLKFYANGRSKPLPYHRDNKQIERRAGVHLPPKSKNFNILNGGSKPPPYN